jgi:hypothetical protein
MGDLLGDGGATGSLLVLSSPPTPPTFPTLFGVVFTASAPPNPAEEEEDEEGALISALLSALLSVLLSACAWESRRSMPHRGGSKDGGTRGNLFWGVFP